MKEQKGGERMKRKLEKWEKVYLFIVYIFGMIYLVGHFVSPHKLTNNGFISSPFFSMMTVVIWIYGIVYIIINTIIFIEGLLKQLK